MLNYKLRIKSIKKIFLLNYFFRDIKKEKEKIQNYYKEKITNLYEKLKQRSKSLNSKKDTRVYIFFKLKINKKNNFDRTLY